MAAAAACLLPLLLQLPFALALALGTVAAVGYWLDRPWPAALRILLIFMVAGYLLVTFGFSIGRDTGTALLAALLAIKPGETRSLRDARSLIGFSLFAPFAAFLQDQGPLTLAFSLVAVTLLLVAMAMLAEHRPGAPPPRANLGRLRTVALVVLVGLPLAMVGFWLFPRLAVPLWGMPENVLGRGGLNDRMTPDEWVEMFADDRAALRVRFFGEAPRRQDLYWRAQVLWNFDGQSWRRDFGTFSTPTPRRLAQSPALSYEVAMEPTDMRYLVVLDTALEAPEGGRMLADGSVIADAPVSHLRRYSGRSALVARAEEELGVEERRLALTLPAGLNPRMRALGARWRQEAGGDDVAIVRRALTWIGEDFSYSLTVPPTGRNAVDEFLFDTRVGFCQHFSSAFANLMRAAGIPTRVVLGYAGGYRNPYGDYWQVRRMDAHAWTEIWLDGRGWTRVDPTAAVAPARILDTIEDRARSEALLPETFTPLRDFADWARRNWNDMVLGFDAARQAQLFRPLGVDQASTGQIGLAFAVGAGAVMALTLWFLMRGRPPARDPLAAAWRRFVRRMARAGLGKPAWEPPRAYGERLAAALPLQAEPLVSLSRRYAAWRYARGQLPAEEKAKLIADLQAFRPARPARPGESP